MARSAAAKAETSTVVLEAAKKMLRQNGYSKLSTRDVAAAAGVPLSQIFDNRSVALAISFE